MQNRIVPWGHVTQLKRNIIANLVGRMWAAAMALAFVPLYIKTMGIEAYGLVGLFTTLQAMFALLDAGLSTTLNRESARLSARAEAAQELRDLVRTLEVVYWAMAALIAVIVFALAAPIARYWLNPDALTGESVTHALIMIGLTIALQFPFGLYTGGLLGLQRQVLFNAITISIATLRGLGSLVVLWWVSPTIEAFFAWQIVVSVAQSASSAFFLWRSLPHGNVRARFRLELLHTIWRFTAGMAGIGVLSLLLMQMDKIILSKLLPLEMFGYYNLAAVVASGLAVLISPVFTAAFPQLSQLVASGKDDAVPAVYHQTCQLMAVLLMPVATVLALFAPEILLLWTGGNAEIVQQAHLLISLLVLGTALNGLVNIPYALQLAYGWTRLALIQNAIAVVLLVPLLFWATGRYGAPGAAAIWVLLNGCYILISVQIMHRRLLPAEKRSWYTYDVAVPVLASMCTALLGRWLLPVQASLPVLVVSLTFIAAGTYAVTAFVTPTTNRLLRQLISTKKQQKIYVN